MAAKLPAVPPTEKQIIDAVRKVLPSGCKVTEADIMRDFIKPLNRLRLSVVLLKSKDERQGQKHKRKAEQLPKLIDRLIAGVKTSAYDWYVTDRVVDLMGKARNILATAEPEFDSAEKRKRLRAAEVVIRFMYKHGMKPVTTRHKTCHRLAAIAYGELSAASLATKQYIDLFDELRFVKRELKSGDEQANNLATN